MAVTITVDEDTMNDLLAEPGVKENYEKMAPEVQQWFRELLVKEGVYSKYVLGKATKKVVDSLKGE